MNYYELLEVSPSASVEAIKNAYKTLAKKYHPDAYRGDKAFAEEKMKELNEAISVLEDEVKRREYNMLNGIYESAEIFDDGKGLNISVDENGEPAFFSSAPEDDVVARKGSFMDTIDDFLGKRGKRGRKAKAADLDDLSQDMSEPDNAGEGIGGIRDISEMMPGTAAADEYNTQDFMTVKLQGSRARAGSAPRWYYILTACLAAGCVIAFFMVLGSVNFENIAGMIGGLGGSGGEEPTTAYHAEPTTAADDYAGHTEAATEPPPPDILAPTVVSPPDTAPEPTSATAPPATTVRQAAPLATTAPPRAEPTVPPPPPPTTEPPPEHTVGEPDYADITVPTDEPPVEEPTTPYIPEEPPYEPHAPEPPYIPEEPPLVTTEPEPHIPDDFVAEPDDEQ